MAYCVNCGAQLEEGMRFCGKCGHEVKPLEDMPAADAQPTSSSPQEVIELSGHVMHDVVASTAVGETVLSSWQDAAVASAPAASSPAAAPTSAPSSKKKRQRGRSSAQSSSASAATRPSAPKKSKLPKIIGGLAAVVVIAFVALYIVPLFIPHPHDPNSHVALTSSTASTSNTNASSSASATSATSTSTPSASSAASTSSASSNSSTASSEAKPSTSTAPSSAAGPTSFSTDERPMLTDFAWLDGEAAKGNVPADAKRIVDFGACMGGWKCYLYGSDMEWLASALVDAGQSGSAITIDWYYLRIGGSGSGQEDTTPSSTFTGSFDGGMLDATGPGRITLAAFWEKDGHQYATGSFMWPDGEVYYIALVRP